jgi:hypothetical protein
VIVWIWEASGPRRRVLGVCSTEDMARGAVESELIGRHVTFGSIEMARMRFGLCCSYEPSGHGETAVLERRSGSPMWTPFEVRQAAS